MTRGVIVLEYDWPDSLDVGGAWLNWQRGLAMNPPLIAAPVAAHIAVGPAAAAAVTATQPPGGTP